MFSKVASDCFRPLLAFEFRAVVNVLTLDAIRQ